eukprot:2622524-Ditylum_brightwellii.AAC.3
MNPLAFAAKASSSDMPNYWHAMNCPDTHLFIEAMKAEMTHMENLDALGLIDKKDVPFTESGFKRTVIESTWAFKVKRTPGSTVEKKKAQLCPCGDQRVNSVDYFEMFVPVVSCNMVQTMMTLAVTLGLKS